VGVSAEVEKDRLLRDFPVKVKIASRGDINRIIQFGLEGVSVSFIQHPPGACSPRPDFFYFKLDPAGAAWNGIRGAKNLAIFPPQDMPGLSLDLLGMRG
jgi:type VI secretion system protein ImpJ